MKINDVVIGKIIKIEKTHLIVSINKNQTSIVHISDISDYYVKNLNLLFNLNSEYEFQVIKINKKDKKINLS
jgi:predicted RNA-binding protein with RPS1 domain